MIGRGWSGYAAMSCVRPFAQERLRLRSDGRVALELKTAWHDGTRELVFEPLEFLERLAAMTPRPEKNLLICHGLLAPRARWRPLAVAYSRARRDPAGTPLAVPPPAPSAAEKQWTPRSGTERLSCSGASASMC